VSTKGSQNGRKPSSTPEAAFILQPGRVRNRKQVKGVSVLDFQLPAVPDRVRRRVHLVVLAGSGLHFLAVLRYVIPR